MSSGRDVDNAVDSVRMVPPTVVRCERYLAGAFRRGADHWPVLSLRTLVESPSFQDAAA